MDRLASGAFIEENGTSVPFPKAGESPHGITRRYTPFAPSAILIDPRSAFPIALSYHLRLARRTYANYRHAPPGNSERSVFLTGLDPHRPLGSSL
jgi:hypothetical protein